MRVNDFVPIEKVPVVEYVIDELFAEAVYLRAKPLPENVLVPVKVGVPEREAELTLIPQPLAMVLKVLPLKVNPPTAPLISTKEPS
jgi:hypothetical protein